MDARVKPAHDKRATLDTGPDSLSLMHGSAKVGMIRLTVAIFIFISNLSFAANAQERVVIGTQRLTENGALFIRGARLLQGGRHPTRDDRLRLRTGRF